MIRQEPGNQGLSMPLSIITPSLCVPVILGGLFLAHNNIVVDHVACTAIDKNSKATENSW